MENMTDGLLKEKIASALAGRELWISLIEKYSLTSRSQVLLVPHGGHVYMDVTIENLGWLAVHKKADKILVLGTGSAVIPENITGDVPCFYQETDGNACNSLLNFYSLYEFTVNMQVISLSLPEGRKGQGLVDAGKLSLNEALSVIVFENYG